MAFFFANTEIVKDKSSNKNKNIARNVAHTNFCGSAIFLWLQIKEYQ